MHAATNKRGDYAEIAVNSLAYSTLIDSLNNKAWADEDLDLDTIYNPGKKYTVQVPTKVAVDVKNFLEPEIKKVADSFIDLENFNVTYARADGIANYDTPKNIEGMLIGRNVGGDVITLTNDDRMQRVGVFHIKAVLDYLLF